MKKTNVLFVSGIPNNKLVEVVSISTTNSTKYIMTGSTNVYNNINDKRINKRYQKLDLSTRQRINLKDVDIIFNQIADSDSHSKVLNKLDRIIKSTKKDIKVINQPNLILETSRNRIYSKLKDIPNLKLPKTIKFVPMSPQNIKDAIKKYRFKLPVILRKTGTHGGDTVKLVESFDDIEKLYDVALDGAPFYLIEFIDYKEDGIYRKFRLVIVNGRVYIRHVLYDKNWMIHSRSRDFMKLNPIYSKKEVEIIENFEEKIVPKIQPIIDQIYKKIKLDYFGIDCVIDKNHNILLFELNANMNIIINTANKKISQSQVDLIKEAICEMILKKGEE